MGVLDPDLDVISVHTRPLLGVISPDSLWGELLSEEMNILYSIVPLICMLLPADIPWIWRWSLIMLSKHSEHLLNVPACGLSIDPLEFVKL